MYGCAWFFSVLVVVGADDIVNAKVYISRRENETIMPCRAPWTFSSWMSTSKNLLAGPTNVTFHRSLKPWVRPRSPGTSPALFVTAAAENRRRAWDAACPVGRRTTLHTFAAELKDHSGVWRQGYGWRTCKPRIYGLSGWIGQVTFHFVQQDSFILDMTGWVKICQNVKGNYGLTGHQRLPFGCSVWWQETMRHV